MRHVADPQSVQEETQLYIVDRLHFLDTILETDESERTNSSSNHDDTVLLVSDVEATSSSSDEYDDDDTSNVSHCTAVLSKDSKSLLIGQNEIQSRTNHLNGNNLNECVKECPQRRSVVLKGSFIRTSSPVSDDHSLYSQTGSESTNNQLDNSQIQNIEPVFFPRKNQTVMQETEGPLVPPRRHELEDGKERIAYRYPSSHGESGFDTDRNSGEQDMKIKRSPAVIGVSDLLAKTDYELEEIMIKNDRLLEPSDVSICSNDLGASSLPLNDFSFTWSPHVDQKMQYGSSTDYDCLSDSIDNDSSSNILDNDSIFFQNDLAINFENIPDDTLKMIQEMSQQTYNCCSASSPKDEYPTSAMTMTDFEMFDNIPYIDSEHFYGEDWIVGRNGQKVPWLQMATKANLDEVTLDSFSYLDEISSMDHVQREKSQSRFVALLQRMMPVKRSPKRKKKKKASSIKGVRKLCTCLSSNNGH